MNNHWWSFGWGVWTASLFTFIFHYLNAPWFVAVIGCALAGGIAVAYSVIRIRSIATYTASHKEETK